jgi:fumarate hydratase, class II
VAHVIGADATIAYAGATMGLLDLHVGMPVMAYNFLEAVRLLSNAARVFAERCVAELEVDAQRAEQLVEQSLAMCTALAPVIGYDRAAAIAKQAHATGKTVRQVALEEKVLAPEKLNELLDARRMTEPQE